MQVLVCGGAGYIGSHMAKMLVARGDQVTIRPVGILHALVRAALDAAGVRYRYDFYTDAVHGYAPRGTDRYNRFASEQHWERVHSLLQRNL